MTLIIPIAIFLVVATVVAAVFTSHQLGIMRKAIYQLESAAGELRRQLEDMETEKRQAAGRIRALPHLHEQKMMDLEGLYAELKALTSDDPKQVASAPGWLHAPWSQLQPEPFYSSTSLGIRPGGSLFLFSLDPVQGYEYTYVHYGFRLPAHALMIFVPRRRRQCP